MILDLNTAARTKLNIVIFVHLMVMVIVKT